MMTSPSKRALTEEMHASIVALNTPSHSATPSDLAARLRSVGSRVRKTVTEGYVANSHSSAPSSLSSSPTKPTSTGNNLFRSANDTLREVFSPRPSGNPPSISPKKRTREDSDCEYGGDAVDEDDDTEMQVDNPAPGGEAATFVLDPDLKSGRPVKSLRDRSRAATKKRSPPSDTHAKMVESSNLSVHREFVQDHER